MYVPINDLQYVFGCYHLSFSLDSAVLVEFQHVDIQNGKILCLKFVLFSLQKIIFAGSQFYDVL